MSNVLDLPAVPREANFELLDTEQAAKFLSLMPSTLNKERCTRSLGIPFVKIGRSVRYRRSDLESYIESCLISC